MPLAGQAFFNIPVAPIRVSADNSKAFATQVFMANACWYDQDIAGFHGYLFSAFASKMQQSRTRIHAQHFVSIAMIMVKRINAVPPGISPVIFGKSLLQPF